MKQLKKIEILPLTDLDNLNLDIVEKKNYDFTGIDEDIIKELFSKLYKIAESSSGVIIASKLGDKNYVNTQIKGTRDKNKIFTFPEPNPICIYYNSANEHLQESYKLKNKFFSEEQNFSVDYNYENFIKYFQKTSEGIILLSTTIESFINQLLPENLQLEIDGAIKTKSGIEWLDIKSKLREVIPKLMHIDFQKTNEKDYNNISLIIDLRNDLIHLKKSVRKNITHYQRLSKRLIDFDHISCSDSVFIFVNTIVPNYLVEKK